MSLGRVVFDENNLKRKVYTNPLSFPDRPLKSARRVERDIVAVFDEETSYSTGCPRRVITTAFDLNDELRYVSSLPRHQRSANDCSSPVKMNSREVSRHRYSPTASCRVSFHAREDDLVSDLELPPPPLSRRSDRSVRVSSSHTSHAHPQECVQSEVSSGLPLTSPRPSFRPDYKLHLPSFSPSSPSSSTSSLSSLLPSKEVSDDWVADAACHWTPIALRSAESKAGKFNVSNIFGVLNSRLKGTHSSLPLFPAYITPQEYVTKVVESLSRDTRLRMTFDRDLTRVVFLPAVNSNSSQAPATRIPPSSDRYHSASSSFFSRKSRDCTAMDESTTPPESLASSSEGKVYFHHLQMIHFTFIRMLVILGEENKILFPFGPTEQPQLDSFARERQTVHCTFTKKDSSFVSHSSDSSDVKVNRWLQCSGEFWLQRVLDKTSETGQCFRLTRIEDVFLLYRERRKLHLSIEAEESMLHEFRYLPWLNDRDFCPYDWSSNDYLRAIAKRLQLNHQLVFVVNEKNFARSIFERKAGSLQPIEALAIKEPLFLADGHSAPKTSQKVSSSSSSSSPVIPTSVLSVPMVAPHPSTSMIALPALALNRLPVSFSLNTNDFHPVATKPSVLPLSVAALPPPPIHRQSAASSALVASRTDPIVDKPIAPFSVTTLPGSPIDRPSMVTTRTSPPLADAVITVPVVAKPSIPSPSPPSVTTLSAPSINRPSSSSPSTAADPAPASVTIAPSVPLELLSLMATLSASSINRLPESSYSFLTASPLDVETLHSSLNKSILSIQPSSSPLLSTSDALVQRKKTTFSSEWYKNSVNYWVNTAIKFVYSSHGKFNVSFMYGVLNTEGSWTDKKMPPYPEGVPIADYVARVLDGMSKDKRLLIVAAPSLPLSKVYFMKPNQPKLVSSSSSSTPAVSKDSLPALCITERLFLPKKLPSLPKNGPILPVLCEVSPSAEEELSSPSTPITATFKATTPFPNECPTLSAKDVSSSCFPLFPMDTSVSIVNPNEEGVNTSHKLPGISEGATEIISKGCIFLILSFL